MDATLTFTVTDDDTALAVGSGSLPVLGTPAAAGLVRGGDLRRDRPDAARGLDQRRHPDRARAPGRQPGRPGGRGHRLLVVRRRAAAPVHRRRPPPSAATARWSAPARSPGSSSTPSGSCPGCDRRRADFASGAPFERLALGPPGQTRLDQEDTMGKTGRKRRARKKKGANHGKRPNA